MQLASSSVLVGSCQLEEEEEVVVMMSHSRTFHSDLNSSVHLSSCVDTLSHTLIKLL